MSEESETCGLRDGGRTRGAPQLATDVRNVAVNGMRAQHQLLCDFAIAQSPRDAGENLAFTLGQQHLFRLVRTVRRRLRGCQCFAARANHGIDITVPREVRAPLQRDERRARNRSRDLTPEPKRHGAVVATVHHQCRRANKGKVRAYVEAIDEDQATRRRSRRWPPPAESAQSVRAPQVRPHRETCRSAGASRVPNGHVPRRESHPPHPEPLSPRRRGTTRTARGARRAPDTLRRKRLRCSSHTSRLLTRRAPVRARRAAHATSRLPRRWSDQNLAPCDPTYRRRAGHSG